VRRVGALGPSRCYGLQMSLKAAAEDTLAIIERGHYLSAGGKTVLVRDLIDAAVRGTVLLRPDDLDTPTAERGQGQAGPAAITARLEITPETTAQAARRLVEQEGVPRVFALNFASAKNPGGGFLRGASAQEEDLARCSALYPCQLTQRAYYDANRALGSMLYSDHFIYSPDVPFFRGERLELLEAPFLVSVLTAPAPNAGEAQRNERKEGRAVRATLERRARKVLLASARFGHRTLVLGAWGCGVFRNDPPEVADAFALGLADPALAGAFDRVTFAIWERDKARPTLRAFESRLNR
jgi:uncharacterized protein (TIGR02452 family)